MENKSFWMIEEEVTGKMEMGSEIEPIPSKTQCLAAIDEIKWDSYEGDEYISARWNVLQPAEFKNRKIFQKIKVKEADEKKRHKAIKMLAAIDFNAKGGLMTSGKEPTDALMQKGLMNKPMIIMLQIWAMENTQTGETKKGNWVSAVSPRNANQPERVVPIVHENVYEEPASANKSYSAAPVIDVDEDEIPF